MTNEINEQPATSAPHRRQVTAPPRRYEALQWTGDNLAEVQQFMQPDSPLFDARTKARTLTILLFDPDDTRRYPSLGRQTKLTTVAPGDWIVRTPEGDWIVRDHASFVGEFGLPAGPADAEPPPESAPAPDDPRADGTGVPE